MHTTTHGCAGNDDDDDGRNDRHYRYYRIGQEFGFITWEQDEATILMDIRE